jgi:hypothetical protein
MLVHQMAIKQCFASLSADRSMGFHEGAFGFGSKFARTCNRDSLAAHSSDAGILLYWREHNRKQALGLAAFAKKSIERTP